MDSNIIVMLDGKEGGSSISVNDNVAYSLKALIVCNVGNVAAEGKDVAWWID